MTATSQIISALNNLIQICKDDENGYQAAAKVVTNTDLRSLFESYAQQRGLYAGELRSEVQRLGGDPVNHGSLTAPAKRVWTNVKSTLSSDREHTVIADCESAEDATRDAYQDILKNELPAPTQALLERQLAGIKEAHERVRALEAATAHT